MESEMRTIYVSKGFEGFGVGSSNDGTDGYVVQVTSDELQRLLCDVPLEKLPEELQKIVEKTTH